MWIQTGNIYSKLVRATVAEQNWLREFLTFANLSFNHKGSVDADPSSSAGRKPKRPRIMETCLLNKSNNTFPSGLMNKVIIAAKGKHAIQLIDKRVKPCEYDENSDLLWLRDYQRDALDEIVKRKRGIVWIPTGGGKGEIICAVTRALPCNWLFVVHRGGLVHDIAKRYDQRARGIYPGGRLDPNISDAERRLISIRSGLIADGQWNPATPSPEGSLTCATFQSLSAAMGSPKFLELVKNVDGVMFDEAHTLPADTFWRSALAMSNAYYRIGFSGTPLARGDKKSVYTIAATGPVIYRIKTTTLVKRGILARPKIKMIECEQESEKPTWQGVYGEKVVRSVQRNKLVVEAAKKANKPCLVFVKEVKHGKVIRDRLEKAGVLADFVWGTTPQAMRDMSVDYLVKGMTDVLVCSVVFQEGLDIPELESVVIASGGKSIIATLQRIGRGMRSNQGKKKTFEVVDFMDKGNKHLTKHARKRRKAYLQEGHEVQVVQRP